MLTTKSGLVIKNPLELGRIYIELGRITVLIARCYLKCRKIIFICLKEGYFVCKVRYRPKHVQLDSKIKVAQRYFAREGI